MISDERINEAAGRLAERFHAFLALRIIDFPYTHNISLLPEIASRHAEWIKDLSEAETLTDYAVTVRYPGAEKVTKKDAELEFPLLS